MGMLSIGVLKVYKDSKNRGYEDCTVSKIDGKNAMAQVKKRAEVLYNSKDPNVRLNEALAYELKCTNSTTSTIVNDQWTVSPQLPWEFTDTASHVKNVCLAQPAPVQPSDASASSILKRGLDSIAAKDLRAFYPFSKRAVFDNHQAQAAVPPPPVTGTNAPSLYPEAIKIGAGNCTVFYQLRDRPTIGIIVLYVTMIDFAEIDFMYQSLETLYQNGVTEILIDVVGGDGGYANVGSDLAQLFFPNKEPLEKSFHMNFRVTPAIQQLSAKVYSSTDGGWGQNLGNMLSLKGGAFYDSARFFDLANNRIYTNNSLFLDTVSKYRYGRQAVYTKPAAYRPVTHPVHPNLAKYPWTNNPDRLRIVTDGRCLSACAHVVYLLANQYKVLSYGIGGTPGEPLSKYQYAAGTATNLGTFNGIFAFVNMTSPVKDLPYQSILAIAVGEIIAPGNSIPLEFDSPRYPTDFRLDYDLVNAHSREALWTQVAKAAWK
ncbi:hypothetical protein BGX29_004981 [Mortierella sp. GBA35]|nr:hypothetical protein BGX29_004981 [Mortierella sp. GBA35]